MTQRRSLSDILRGDRDRLQQAWDQAEAAQEFAPLPAGEYVCHLVAADLFNARMKGTPGVKLAFKVIEGQYAGRMFWHDCWLTEAAVPQSKRDLAKLGITRLEQIERPLPPGIRCKVKVALRRDDDGNERNRVRGFEVVGHDKPEADPFAPGGGDAAEPEGPADVTFDPKKFDANHPHADPRPTGEGEHGGAS